MNLILIFLVGVLAGQAQIPPFGTNYPCTNCPTYTAVNALTNDPLLHFKAERRVQHTGTTYHINGWQWDYAPYTNAIVVYNSDGSEVPSLAEPNGVGNLGILDAWTVQPHASNQVVGVIDDTQIRHGLFVSGCIAAEGGDGSNTVGVARHVRLLQKDLGGDTVVSNRIWELVQEGATVINMSFGWTGRTYPVKTINAMRDHPGVIFTVAGANANLNIDDPAIFDSLCQCRLPNVVCVAASTKADQKMNPGIWGTNVFGYAPGRRVVVEAYPWTASNAVVSLSFAEADEPRPELRGSVNYESGSSFSAPKVAGIIALLKERYPMETVPETLARLAAGCEQIGALAGLSRFGRFNAYRSLIFARAKYLTISPDGISAAGPPGSVSEVDWSPDLTTWTYFGSVTNDGFPHFLSPRLGEAGFFRVR